MVGIHFIILTDTIIVYWANAMSAMQIFKFLCSLSMFDHRKHGVR